MKFLTGVLGALVLAAPAQGAIADVSISGAAFNPPTTTIDQGDSVRWTNNDFLQHTVTFSGFGSPGTLGNGDVFEHVFDSAGTFSYLCTLHAGMNGSVTVYGPTALAQAMPTTPDVGEAVSFDGTGSFHNDRGERSTPTPGSSTTVRPARATPWGAASPRRASTTSSSPSPTARVLPPPTSSASGSAPSRVSRTLA